ncbi:cytochrome d ubiquinol oxidase subunit II [Rhodohalobacter sp. 614A]|uniref:cytochrome d ubiquinol oxidase subunit II n=1 Tax=Rhodohalobacter sp. 614A TaxID=2908649 RepID=UPI001F2CE6FB|nr:cytochrome d ubiquinol oxidase subunit II [Rhodohalobacter sp. 614A]
MLIEAIIFFLGLAIVFYVLFGGADFGAGVLELISGKGDRETIAHAIGPVWEANHVWLILVVVILFMGFPKIYSTMSLYLHIPLLIMLIGIVFRGTAFAFMHYDAIQGKSNKVYNWVFKTSSLITPLFLGIVIGAVVLGKITASPQTFFEGFVAPWLNLFSFTVGLFTLILFAFLAAVYLIGETTDDKQISSFTTIAKTLNACAVSTGILIFSLAEINGLPLFSMYINSPFAMGMVAFASLSIPVLWWALKTERKILSRVVAAGQVISILLAWFWVQMPVVIRMAGNTQDLTFYNSVAPDATLWQLFWALVVGSCIILPSLYYLMKVFKGDQFDPQN